MAICGVAGCAPVLTYDPVRCFAKRAECGIDSAKERRGALSGPVLAGAWHLTIPQPAPEADPSSSNSDEVRRDG